MLTSSTAIQTRGLANEVASLQSRLEQSETERQTLHYQLTLAQKEGRQSTMLLAERESQWNSTQTSLQSELGSVCMREGGGGRRGREGGRRWKEKGAGGDGDEESERKSGDKRWRIRERER